jgi:hypothetical protein
VSENRPYFTVDYLSPEIIAGDKVYTVVDPDGLQFSFLSSSMFISWQRSIGGRLKSDLSFANTLTWNNFPVPKLDATSREEIIKAGQGVLDARALHPERSLAEAYAPKNMDPKLTKAHDALDLVVDKAFGADHPLTTERERLELLFAHYEEMTTSK